MRNRDRVTLLEQEFLARKIEWLDLAGMSELVGLSASTLAKQIRRGKIAAGRQGKRYRVSQAEVMRVLDKNRPMLLGWKRLVDVTEDLGFHRNIGESVCRKEGWKMALDMNGHCRLSPEAEAALHAWFEEKSVRAEWTRKTDLARDIDVDPRVVDNLCRKMKLEIDHDIHGYVILSERACGAILAWKNQRDSRRLKVRQIDGETWYTLRKTAEDAAAGMVHPRSEEFDHLVETYYRRFLLWMRNGLAYTTFDGVRYFDQDVHDRLVDDLCVMEASRLGGVGVSTVKGWLTKGVLSSSDFFKCRRSISRREYFALLRRLYSSSTRLRKREMVPVKILDDLGETVKKIGRANVEDLIVALEKETGIPAKEMDALRYETGFVHRSIKNALDKWVLLAEQGHGSDDSEAMNSLDNEERKRTLHLVATYLQKGATEVYDLVYGSQVVGTAVSELLDEIEKHPSAAVYNPASEYAVGDFLVHPSGGEYGVVVDMPNSRCIKIAWSGELGTITMAQHVESEYAGVDVSSLMLH